MPIRRTLLFVVLAILALTAGLTAGCGKKNSGPLPDAATLLKQSSETTKALKSTQLVLKVTGDKLQKQLKVQSLKGDLTRDPNAAQGHGDVLVSGLPVEGDFVVLGDKLYGSVDPGYWLTFDTKAIYDVSAILDPERGLANVLANFADPEAVSRETVGGVQTVKVTGTVSVDAVNKIAKEIGATKPVAGTAWIREDGDHALVQLTLEPSSGESIQMTLSKWNEPVTITKPDGA